MKPRMIFLLLFLVAACRPSEAKPLPVAAYLVQSDGELSKPELAKHPEILVTENFADVKSAARQRIALWIDKDAIPLVEEGWLDRMPQASYPMIVVGYNDLLVGFGMQLKICCFLGHVITDAEYSATESGFSVLQRESGEPGAATIYGKGFQQTPSVADLLQISKDLLQAKPPSVTP